MIGIELQHPVVSPNRKRVLAGIILQRNPTGKELSHIGHRGFGLHNRYLRTAYHALLRGKVEHELPGDRFDQLALMPKSNPMMASGERSRFEQWILHARHLLLHGLKRLPDHGRADLSGAQIAYFFYLQQVEEGIAPSGGYQSGFFPSCQLARGEPQDANQIRSIVSVHVCKGTLLPLSEKLTNAAIAK